MNDYYDDFGYSWYDLLPSEPPICQCPKCGSLAYNLGNIIDCPACGKYNVFLDDFEKE